MLYVASQLGIQLGEACSSHMMHALAVKASHVQDEQVGGLYVVGGFRATAWSKNNMFMVLCKVTWQVTRH